MIGSYDIVVVPFAERLPAARVPYLGGVIVADARKGGDAPPPVPVGSQASIDYGTRRDTAVARSEQSQHATSSYEAFESNLGLSASAKISFLFFKLRGRAHLDVKNVSSSEVIEVTSTYRVVSHRETLDCQRMSTIDRTPPQEVVNLLANSAATPTYVATALHYGHFLSMVVSYRDASNRLSASVGSSGVLGSPVGAIMKAIKNAILPKSDGGGGVAAGRGTDNLNVRFECSNLQVATRLNQEVRALRAQVQNATQLLDAASSLFRAATTTSIGEEVDSVVLEFVLSPLQKSIRSPSQGNGGPLRLLSLPPRNALSFASNAEGHVAKLLDAQNDCLTAVSGLLRLRTAMAQAQGEAGAVTVAPYWRDALDYYIGLFHDTLLPVVDGMIDATRTSGWQAADDARFEAIAKEIAEARSAALDPPGSLALRLRNYQLWTAALSDGGGGDGGGVLTPAAAAGQLSDGLAEPWVTTDSDVLFVVARLPIPSHALVGDALRLLVKVDGAAPPPSVDRWESTVWDGTPASLRVPKEIDVAEFLRVVRLFLFLDMSRLPALRIRRVLRDSFVEGDGTPSIAAFHRGMDVTGRVLPNLGPPDPISSEGRGPYLHHVSIVYHMLPLSVHGPTAPGPSATVLASDVCTCSTVVGAPGKARPPHLRAMLVAHWTHDCTAGATDIDLAVFQPQHNAALMTPFAMIGVDAAAVCPACRPTGDACNNSTSVFVSSMTDLSVSEVITDVVVVVGTTTAVAPNTTVLGPINPGCVGANKLYLHITKAPRPPPPSLIGLDPLTLHMPCSTRVAPVREGVYCIWNVATRTVLGAVKGSLVTFNLDYSPSADEGTDDDGTTDGTGAASNAMLMVPIAALRWRIRVRHHDAYGAICQITTYEGASGSRGQSVQRCWSVGAQQTNVVLFEERCGGGHHHDGNAGTAHPMLLGDGLSPSQWFLLSPAGVEPQYQMHVAGQPNRRSTSLGGQLCSIHPLDTPTGASCLAMEVGADALPSVCRSADYSVRATRPSALFVLSPQ